LCAVLLSVACAPAKADPGFRVPGRPIADADVSEALESPRLAVRPLGCERAGSGGAILGLLVENPHPGGVGILLPPRPRTAAPEKGEFDELFEAHDEDAGLTVIGTTQCGDGRQRVVLEPGGRLGRATNAFYPAWDGKTPRQVRAAFRWTEFRVSRSTEPPPIQGCRLFTVLLEEPRCTVLDAGTPDCNGVATLRLNMDETSAVSVEP
jgi:hypothetical protein